MTFQFRSLAALAALVALTFSFAEGVWASTCMPGLPMDAASTATEGPHAADCMMDADAEVSSSGNQPAEPPAPPNCPFIPLSVTGSCLVAASLPAASPEGPEHLPEGELLVPSTDQAPGLLLVSAFFRPPRA